MPIKITVQETWPDGSILNGEVVFVTSTSKQASYLLCYGDDVKGSKQMEKTAVLPTIAFSVGGAPRRVWCHLCPVGLINSWFNKGGGLELHKEALKCNKCGGPVQMPVRWGSPPCTRPMRM